MVVREELKPTPAALLTGHLSSSNFTFAFSDTSYYSRSANEAAIPRWNHTTVGLM
jgi:hypothetical protein